MDRRSFIRTNFLAALGIAMPKPLMQLAEIAVDPIAVAVPLTEAVTSLSADDIWLTCSNAESAILNFFSLEEAQFLLQKYQRQFAQHPPSLAEKAEFAEQLHISGTIEEYLEHAESVKESARHIKEHAPLINRWIAEGKVPEAYRHVFDLDTYHLDDLPIDSELFTKFSKWHDLADIDVYCDRMAASYHDLHQEIVGLARTWLSPTADYNDPAQMEELSFVFDKAEHSAKRLAAYMESPKAYFIDEPGLSYITLADKSASPQQSNMLETIQKYLKSEEFAGAAQLRDSRIVGNRLYLLFTNEADSLREALKEFQPQKPTLLSEKATVSETESMLPHVERLALRRHPLPSGYSK